jgi:hypothetical protein|tara:strand:+ start:19 stop:429 length:411 start_codon:yes stop_codon:yes gene_type:complete
MEIYLYNYGDKGLTSLHEKFEISKFEELEKKLYGYGKELGICIKRKPDEDDIFLFGFNALEKPLHAKYKGPDDPNRFWDFLNNDMDDGALDNFLKDNNFITDIAEAEKFIKKHKLEGEEDRRLLAKRFIELFLNSL